MLFEKSIKLIKSLKFVIYQALSHILYKEDLSVRRIFLGALSVLQKLRYVYFLRLNSAREMIATYSV